MVSYREKSRLKVFENWILRRTFGPKSDANREWRRLHNEELFCNRFLSKAQSIQFLVLTPIFVKSIVI
jgi:hypothetical protein